MCLILIALDSHPDYSLIVAANRDEFYERPTAAAAFWDDAPSVLAGRDLQAGGTWLGLNRRGRFAAVTNYRQGEREGAAPRSRGHLVGDFLNGDIGPAVHLKRVRREAESYHDFSLIAGDDRKLFYYSNREGRIRRLTPGIYGLSNHLLDTPWPKVTASKHALTALLQGDPGELTTDLFALLANRRRPADDLLPETGVGPEWERLLSSAFVASGEYGTRSSTVLLVGRDGVVVLVERAFLAGGEPAGEARYRFELEGTLAAPPPPTSTRPD